MVAYVSRYEEGEAGILFLKAAIGNYFSQFVMDAEENLEQKANKREESLKKLT